MTAHSWDSACCWEVVSGIAGIIECCGLPCGNKNERAPKDIPVDDDEAQLTHHAFKLHVTILAVMRNNYRLFVLYYSYDFQQLLIGG